MGYYCHPDTMAMSSASHRAKENADGETNTLKYLKEYRKVYEEQNKGDRFAGLEGYLSELDNMIEDIEKPFHHVVIILISYTTGFSSLPIMATFFGISPMTLAQSQLWFIGVCMPMVIGFLVPTLVLGKKRSVVEVGGSGAVDEAA